MAKGQLERPGTSGSQFFIVTTLDAGLPPDYALVGKVDGDGLEAVNRIEDVPTEGEAPQEPVVIEKATLTEG
jgi:cyclophilin family peptidyl-prolyl cis-trans isomerase